MTRMYDVTHKDDKENIYRCDICGLDILDEEIIIHGKQYHPKEWLVKMYGDRTDNEIMPAGNGQDKEA